MFNNLPQQIQFGMAFLHSAQLLYTDCGYPRWSVCFTLPNAIFFYMLFNDFYKVNINARILSFFIHDVKFIAIL